MTLGSDRIQEESQGHAQAVTANSLEMMASNASFFKKKTRLDFRKFRKTQSPGVLTKSVHTWDQDKEGLETGSGMCEVVEGLQMHAVMMGCWLAPGCWAGGPGLCLCVLSPLQVG